MGAEAQTERMEQKERPARDRWPDERYEVGALLFRDDFAGDGGAPLKEWVPEMEAAGTVEARRGKLVIDVPRGCTVWFRPELSGPLLIEYDATAVQKGGPNDRVSDLNCFWMAQDPKRPGQLLESRRSGKFADYDALRTYYVGQGGNANTTTRFRRYVGTPGNRPLLPEHDLTAPEFLLRPNVKQRIRLVACGGLVQYWRDGRRLFEMTDPEPYTRGWFGLRTVHSHLEIERFRVLRLAPAAARAGTIGGGGAL